MSSALARVIFSANNTILQNRLIQRCSQWNDTQLAVRRDALGPSQNQHLQLAQENSLSKLLEERLQDSVSQRERAAIRAKRKKDHKTLTGNYDEEADYSDASHSTIEVPCVDDIKSLQTKTGESMNLYVDTIQSTSNATCSNPDTSSRIRRPGRLNISNSPLENSQQVVKVIPPEQHLYRSLSDGSEEPSKSWPNISRHSIKSTGYNVCSEDHAGDTAERIRFRREPLSSFDYAFDCSQNKRTSISKLATVKNDRDAFSMTKADASDDEWW